jgi:hypothetical protein
MSWLHRLLGSDGSTQLAVDAGMAAARVSLRPFKYTNGIYQLAAPTGVMAAGLAANAEIFQLRYTGPNLLAVKFAAVNAGGIAAFAAGNVRFDLYVARGWSADGSGGTTITLTGDNNKLRQAMAASLSAVATARISSTAALTAGTKTLDANAMGSVGGGVTATAGETLIKSDSYLFNAETDNEYPILLTSQEGIVVRATVPATGTWTGFVMVKVGEIAVADWGSV